MLEWLQAVAIRRWFGLLATKLAISRPMPDELPVTFQNKKLSYLSDAGLENKKRNSISQAASGGSLYDLMLTVFIFTYRVACSIGSRH